jgi:plastocyanin
MRKMLVGSAILLMLGGATPSLAADQQDQTVVAVAPNSYTPETIQVEHGRSLTFANFDAQSGAGHTLVHAVAEGSRLFESPVVTIGSAAKVPGIDKLAPGTYPIACRIHVIMTGTLVIR